MIRDIYKYWSVLIYILLLLLSGCATMTSYDERYISDKIELRSGFNLPVEFSDSINIPSGIVTDDGLTVEESVAIALWNNKQFQVDMADLGFARADLLQSGMLPNPIFSLLFPVGPKQMEFTLSYAIEVLWQRPKRVAAAKLNTEKVAENLVNNGLALVRNVYVSFADLKQAGESLKIMDDEAALYDEISRIASARLEVGDISKLEETVFRLAASRARETAINARRDFEIQKVRFLDLLGLISIRSDIQIDPVHVELTDIPGAEQLIKSALASRPDLRAAELDIEIAGKQLGWERSKIFNLTAMLDANAEGKEGFEMGPGALVTVPLFDLNQGGTKRAKTEMQRSVSQYFTVQQNIRKGILESYQAYIASKEVYEMLINENLPESEQAVSNGEQAYLTGEISYLEFLEYKRQLLDARLRLINTDAELRKNIASLYYYMGGKMLPLE